MGVKINPYDIVGTQIADAHVEEYIGFYPEKNGKGVKRHYYRYSDVDGETHVTTRDNLMKRKGRNDYSELIGKRYGKIVITKYLGRVDVPGKKGLRQAYECQCDCGNTVIITRKTILSGRINNCGHCYRIVKEEEH